MGYCPRVKQLRALSLATAAGWLMHCTTAPGSFRINLLVLLLGRCSSFYGRRHGDKPTAMRGGRRKRMVKLNYARQMDGGWAVIEG